MREFEEAAEKSAETNQKKLSCKGSPWGGEKPASRKRISSAPQLLPGRDENQFMGKGERRLRSYLKEGTEDPEGKGGGERFLRKERVDTQRLERFD